MRWRSSGFPGYLQAGILAVITEKFRMGSTTSLHFSCRTPHTPSCVPPSHTLTYNPLSVELSVSALPGKFGYRG